MNISSSPLLEVCCGSLEDAIKACKNQADRIELNSALSAGGLTPSSAVLRKVRELCPDLEIICMDRPREGGFAYDDYEKQELLLGAKELLDAGASGIAFGCLMPDGSLDAETAEKMISIIHSAGKQAVFHRAFDVCKDPEHVLEQLIALQADRILTSGCAKSAPEGAQMLARLIEQAQGRIEILPGCGVRPENVIELLEKTGASQVHSSCSMQRTDPSAVSGPVSFACGPESDPCSYGVVSETSIQKMKQALSTCAK